MTLIDGLAMLGIIVVVALSGAIAFTVGFLITFGLFVLIEKLIRRIS